MKFVTIKLYKLLISSITHLAMGFSFFFFNMNLIDQSHLLQLAPFVSIDVIFIKFQCEKFDQILWIYLH